MQEIASHFNGIDWAIVALYLLGTTWIGHRFRGQQATMKDFFLAGRRLPWPAVCGSIIATEISALTFIGVPGMVFAAGGNWTYLQWAIGSIIARFIVGIFFVREFYKREIYSPYDYMANRLGDGNREHEGIRRLTTGLFFIGSILGQSVRLLVTAIILKTVTGLDFHLCILMIGLFAVAWTWIGGMTTVIWTDVVQFFVFVCGGGLALLWMVGTIDGGWAELWHTGTEAGKFRLLDLTTDPAIGFTLWVGILAMPFQNMAAFGTDQLNAQRMFCCRSARDAGKAMIWSSAGQLVTILMLCVGTALFVYYQQHPPTPAMAEIFHNDHDFVFPVWITTVLPAGVSGLIFAGAFAAAISSLDSVLAALSQTSLSLFYKGNLANIDRKGLLRVSRLTVAVWGVALALAAMLLDGMRGNINMVNLAFGMVSYTYGPMLGIFFLALFFPKTKLRGIVIGVVLSILLTLYIRPDVYQIFQNFGILSPEETAHLRPSLHYAWLYPITCGLTVFCGWLFRRKSG